jgi:aerobic-type carbon monoxide dehydrogenase small subunit (CoxS/CutS family)
MEITEKKKINFYYNNQLVSGLEGDSIAAALHALGIRKLSESSKKHRPRGLYCAIGNCSSCHMIVDGIPNTKTCITLLKEGMKVQMQTNKGEWHAS